MHEINTGLFFNKIYRSLSEPMLCSGRLAHLMHYALESCSVEGDYVEFGCWNGSTASLVSVLTGKKVWVYDSFEGLPSRSEMDSGADLCINKGELVADVANVVNAFEGLDQPVIKKAWFSDLTDKDLPEKIAMAYYDGDMYESIYDSLSLAYPHMQMGAIGVVDDYGWDGAPGVRKACDDFFRDKPEIVKSTVTNSSYGYQGVFIKGEET